MVHWSLAGTRTQVLRDVPPWWVVKLFSTNGFNHLLKHVFQKTTILSQDIVQLSGIKQSYLSVCQFGGSGSQMEASGPVFFAV